MMEQLENNAYFWQKMDTLLLSSACKIDHKKGTAHPQYPNLIYPVDYGFLQDTIGTGNQPIHIFKGSRQTHSVESIVVSADILKKDCEVKLLVGCTEEEKLQILMFLNQTQFQKAILIQKGNDTPAWANNE